METDKSGMHKLNLPSYPFQLTEDKEGKLMIYDPLRHKNVRLTPEEWVRQHIIRFLVEEKGVPVGLISVEGGLKVNRLEKRYDALIYNREGIPSLLLECKAPEVKISQKTFDQIAAYNLRIKANYLLISNGLQHFCCRYDLISKRYIFLPGIPHFSDI